MRAIAVGPRGDDDEKATTMTTTVRGEHGMVRALAVEVVRGVAAGLAGGVVFGVVMAATGILPMVAMLIGSSNAVVGAVVHLVISAGLGALFALLVRARRAAVLVGAGLVYGAAWWVLGALLIMPAWLGMPVLVVNEMALWSLLGHLLFGVVTGGVLAALRSRTARG